MITFENISKQYGSTILFESVTVSFHENHRTGLIGVNGSGKSTLLRILGGSEQPDKGTINKPVNLRIGYLPQEVEILDNKTPLDIVLEPFSHVLNFEEQLQSISVKADQESIKGTLKQIDLLFSEVEFHDAYSLVARAKAILAGLGVPEPNWTQPVQLLSGGYRMRAVLGKLLLESPDFMLLDEPTNHLDMDSLVWLEKYLERQKSGMLIVSHDRDFLNRITTKIADISGKTITMYDGNYDQYIRLRDEAEIAAASRARNLEFQIAQTERFVERFKAKASKATQAQSRMKQLEKLRAEVPITINDEKSIHFSFPEPKPSGTVPLKYNAVSAGYDSKTVFERFSFCVNRGDKIAIVGPNGAGKSTLLKLTAGILAPQSGTIDIGHNVTIKYFGQHQLEQLDPEKTLYDTIIKESVSTEKTFVRNILGAFLFSGDSVEKTVKVLSGGEKARLVLATILASPGNVLLLDEPTNHLDIKSVEMLADAMREFKGTILFVSHDEFFISKVATRILEIRPGMIRDFPGTLTDYRHYVETLFSSEQPPIQQKKSDTPLQASDKSERIKEREIRKKLTRVIEKLERDIAANEQKISELQSILDNPEFALDHEKLHTTTQDLESCQNKLQDLFNKWEEQQLELQKYQDG